MLNYFFLILYDLFGESPALLTPFYKVIAWHASSGYWQLLIKFERPTARHLIPGTLTFAIGLFGALFAISLGFPWAILGILLATISAIANLFGCWYVRTLHRFETGRGPAPLRKWFIHSYDMRARDAGLLP
jgi:hypothetical protein